MIVYMAGPLKKEIPSHNVHKPESFWYAYDLNFLPKCDAVLRLPGESYGADLEVEVAIKNGMNVYTDIDQIPSLKQEDGDGKL